MKKIIVYGPAYSVYVRVVRLVLEEKGVPYELRDVDVLSPDGPPSEYHRHHPFGRVPAIEHEGFELFETGAITRYLDESFPGQPLQPAGIRARARMNQIMSLLDSYAYPAMIAGIFFQRVLYPRRGRATDESRVAASVEQAETCLRVLEELMDGEVYLTGPAPSLADLHAVPMIAYLNLTPEGPRILSHHPAVVDWWDLMNKRPSVTVTRFPAENH